MFAGAPVIRDPSTNEVPMPPRKQPAWVLALLTLLPAFGSRAADRPDALAATLECEANTPGGAAAALFREIELDAYRIEELIRGCRSPLLADTAIETQRHLAAWSEVLQELDGIDDNLRSIAAGRQGLSPSQRRAWMELKTKAERIRERARETVRLLGMSILPGPPEQYAQVLLEIRECSIQMAGIVTALDHCGEVRVFPGAQSPMSRPKWSMSIHAGVWE